MQGKLVSLPDYEEAARRVLPKQVWEFLSSGADGQITTRENKAAFQRIKLKAKAFAPANQFKGLQSTILGRPVSSPICVAPTSMHKLMHSAGECATARAALKQDICFGFSSWGNTSYEELYENAPGGVKIAQFYPLKSKEMNRDMLRRMERAGFCAVAVTCDS